MSFSVMVRLRLGAGSVAAGAAPAWAAPAVWPAPKAWVHAPSTQASKIKAAVDAGPASAISGFPGRRLLSTS